MKSAFDQPFLMVFVSLLSALTADFLLKYAMIRAGELDLSGLGKLGAAFKAVFFTKRVSPFIWGGIVLYCVGFFSWLVVLSRIELSIAYPMESMNFVFTIFIARLTLGEKLNAYKLVGTALIVLGVVALSTGI